MDLSEAGEFGLIRMLLDRLPSADLIVPPGDDAAVMRTSEQLVATTDLLVEGRHFDLAFSSPADVGFKAIMVNVSDIAAMGARPRYALIALGAPPATSVSVLEALYDGIAEAARAYDLAIAGGDTVGADQLIVSVALLGEPVGRVVTRSGARAGDLLCVTGELGGAAGGLALLRAAANDASARALLERHPHLAEAHRRGRARVREGMEASRCGAHAMIDVSDGLLADAGHICEMSGVGLLVDAREVPAAEGLDEVERWAGAGSIALSGGDDYELAIAIESDAVDELTRAVAPTALTVVGRFVEGAGVEVSGAQPPETTGWDSFR